MGLGSALRYLHAEWEQCVVHGDIKPSNIMLDSSLDAKLGDFGLARLVDHGVRPATTKVVLGTAGYIDPELVNTRRPSAVSDVYSFGVVLLELVTGRRPVEEPDDSDELFVLARWVWRLYRRNAVAEAVDERLMRRERDDDDDDDDGEVVGERRRRRQQMEMEMERALVVGLWCAHPDRSERPSIARAMHVLQSTPDVVKLPVLRPQMYSGDTFHTVAMGGDGYSDLSFGVTSSSTGSDDTSTSGYNSRSDNK
jgi:serine/threonine protein kinase